MYIDFNFAKRLSELRTQKGVSARDMSLSLGQNPTYIHKIENGTALPSMMGFFYICEYLNIEPSDFFAVDRPCGQGLDGTTLKGEIGNDQKWKALYE